VREKIDIENGKKRHRKGKRNREKNLGAEEFEKGIL